MQTKHLFSIASSVGTPICTDVIASKPMFDWAFGHFVRILVIMDLSAQPTYNVLIERQWYAFFLNIEYENVPKFCSHCNSIGNSLDACKKLNSYIVNRHTRKQPEKTFFKAKDGKINMHGER